MLRLECVPNAVVTYGSDRRFQLIRDAIARVRAVCGSLADVIEQCTAVKAKHRPDSHTLVQACSAVREQVRMLFYNQCFKAYGIVL